MTQRQTDGWNCYSNRNIYSNFCDGVLFLAPWSLLRRWLQLLLIIGHWGHSLIHLLPAHHSHPPSHTHYFIPGSKLTTSANLFHHILLAPTWTMTIKIKSSAVCTANSLRGGTNAVCMRWCWKLLNDVATVDNKGDDDDDHYDDDDDDDKFYMTFSTSLLTMLVHMSAEKAVCCGTWYYEMFFFGGGYKILSGTPVGVGPYTSRSHGSAAIIKWWWSINQSLDDDEKIFLDWQLNGL